MRRKLLNSIVSILITMSFTMGMAQGQSQPQWSISNIKFSVLNEINGTFVQDANTSKTDRRTAQEVSIIEVTANFSYSGAKTSIPDIKDAGPIIPLPAIRLSGGATGQKNSKAWSFEPIAVGFNTPSGCTSYYFLDSTFSPNISRTSDGVTVNIGISGTKIGVSGGSTASLCLAFPAPASSQDMNLEVEGTKLPLSDATQSTTFSLKITAPPSYAGVFRVGGAWGASVPRCPKPAVEPNYTDAARSARVNGSVKTDSVVNKDGSVSVINFVQKLGYGLDEAAKKFVEKNFKCKPGTLQGQPVATWVKIDINFHLYR